MLKLLLLLILFSNLSAQKSNLSKDLELSISNKDIVFSKNRDSISQDRWIECIIKNNSENDYAIVIDTTLNFLYRSDYIENTEITTLKVLNNELDKQLFQPGFMFNKNLELNVGDLYNDDYIKALKPIKEIVKNNLTIIKSKEEFMFKKKISYPNIENLIDEIFGMMVFFFNKENTHTFNLFLFQDKKFIIKNMDKSDYKKLKKNKVKLYDSTLISNEGTIRFE